jgi:hypothetical protein
MKNKPVIFSLIVIAVLFISTTGTAANRQANLTQSLSLASAPGTSFTYQGYLESGGSPVNDSCDFEFSLWDAASEGTQIGTTQTLGGQAITDGLFTVQLDFGGSVFSGDARWLGISVRCPAGNGSYTPLTPRQALSPAPYALALPGLWTQQNATSPNLIGGYSGNTIADGLAGVTIGGGGQKFHPNTVQASGGTVAGGWRNTINSDAATAAIGGGTGNTISGWSWDATIGGGNSNIISGTLANQATIGGGNGNVISGTDASYATVSGGVGNTVSGMVATIGGGGSNIASGEAATIGGGRANSASGDYATIAGGKYISVTGQSPTVAGGAYITVTADYAAIGGGQHNGITSTLATHATIGGGLYNTAGDYAATIGGGDFNTASRARDTIGGGAWNTASGGNSFVGGGWFNTASGFNATVGGGDGNFTSSDYGTIGGGTGNGAFDSQASTIGGGWNNIITGTAQYATIAGGQNNIISATHGTIAGGGYSSGFGWGNRVSDEGGVIGGGGNNQAGNNTGTTTDAYYSTVSGGWANTAAGKYAVIGGGHGNAANANYATVPGGNNNVASGIGSLAAGENASATHDHSFVWGDGSGAAFSTNTNQFLALADNGVGFYTGFGNCTFFSGTNWTCSSDRNLKENFTLLDSQEVLVALTNIPITRWNMKGQNPNIYHVGPMAQDFYAAFVLGEDDEHINTGDEIGIAYAAIQGLHQINQEQAGQITELQAQNAELETRLTALEQNSGEWRSIQSSQIFLLFGGLLAGGFAWKNKKAGDKQ